MAPADGPETLPTAVAYDPFNGPSLERVSATTEAQREVFAAASWEAAASCAYNEGFRLRFAGPLQAPALEAAITALLARHEALRASFTPDGTRMCIAAPTPCRLVQTALTGGEQPAELERLYQRTVATPFDLVHGPLIHWQLVSLSADGHEHELIVCAHHLVCDGWSTGILVQELCALYNAELSGKAPQLAPALPYSDYAAAVPAAAAAGLPYWQNRFRTLPPALDLPLDHPRPALKTYAARRLESTLPPELPARLRALGAKAKSSLLAVLTTGFYALLHRLSQQTEIVIGIPAAGQAPVAGKTLVGHCVHLLPLLHAVDPAAGFAANLQAVRTQLFDAFDHQGLTYGTLLRHLQLPRDAARSPLVAVMLNLDQALPSDALAFAGLTATFHSLPRHYEYFELFLNVVVSSTGISIEAQYNTDLFAAATIRDWLDSYAVLLDGAASAPDTPIAALPILAPAAQALLTQTWNATQAPPPPWATLAARLAAVATATPDATAIASSVGRRSFQELRRGADQLAQHLAFSGVRPGDLVGIALERGPDLLTGLLGILTAGAAYVPIDPSYPRERIALMLADTQMPALVTSTTLAAHLPPHTATVICLDSPSEAQALRAYPEVWREPPVRDPESPAYVIFTSGSTGKPKGVVVPERAMVNFLASMARAPGMTAKDTLLAVTTVSFDIHVLELFLPLTCGAAVHIATLDEASDPAALAKLIAESAITVMQATPATWQLLLSSGWRGAAQLKVLVGGEALPRDLLRRLLPMVASVWNMYGPTETTVWSTCQQLQDAEAPILIGKPIANTQVYIVDERMQLVPIGVSGELLIGGEGVSHGYLARQDLTAARFIADPFRDRPGARLYRTGDLARWRRSGALECLGRNDQQVKLRGFRIELGEIETALVGHPAVGQAVCGIRDKAPGDPRLIAWYVARPGQRTDAAALRTLLQATLPAYMVPQAFQELRELPLTPNGKIDRARLQSPFALSDASSQTRADAGTTLPPVSVDTRAASAPGRQRRLALTPPQVRILELQAKAPTSSLFNLPTGFRLRGNLDQDALRGALASFVARHDSLRTTFSRSSSGVYEQVIAPTSEFVLAAIDLSNDLPPEQENRLQADFQRIAEEPFDLARGPLLKALLYRLSAETHVLFIQAHHAIWDGWSFDLFVKEAGQLYTDARAHRPPSLPPLKLSYADYWLQPAATVAAAPQIAYWRAQLADWRGPVRVPAARARPNVPTRRGASTSYSMPRDLVDSLALLGKEHGATLYMVLLAAFQVLLYRLSDQDDIVVATPVRGRGDETSEALVGCFVGQVLLRARLAPAASFSSTLSELRVTITQGLAQDQVPLATLASELGLGDPAALETVAFSFQDARGRAGSFGDLPYQQINVEPKACGGELSFWVKEGRDQLLGSMNYATDVFTDSEIRALLTAYNALLFAIVADPHTSLAALPLDLDDARLRDVRSWYAAISAAEARAKQHPAVRDCILSVRPAGAEPARLVVHYTVNPHDYLTTTDLRQFLRGTLPIGCEPLAIELDPGEGGEILDRQKLTLSLTQPPATSAGLVPPASSVERQIAAIWAELLGTPVASIGTQANFFELGGHSLLAIQMIAKIEQATGVKLGRMAVTLSTLGQIAAAIDTSHEIKIAPVAAVAGSEHDAASAATTISAADARPPQPAAPPRPASFGGRLWQRLRGGD